MLTLPFHVVQSQQRPELRKGPTRPRLVITLSCLPAPVLSFNVALEPRAGVAKLEHETLGKVAEVDGVWIRNVMKRGIEKLLYGYCQRHVAVNETFGFHHRSRHREDINFVSLGVVGLFLVKHQHHGERMMRCTGN